LGGRAEAEAGEVSTEGDDGGRMSVGTLREPRLEFAFVLGGLLAAGIGAFSTNGVDGSAAGVDFTETGASAFVEIFSDLVPLA